ncbi:AT-rich interactive domain-containing protein 2 [Carex littledalei]|uniref:AT-rich interactive domain-containing protein 2 n=1 Tax=Carex littledalei TaxID=544730 RepID=A0A833VCL3_9POAL|nr:AT-rich interactive domain-containing protein 2 [Carex littledalei]
MAGALDPILQNNQSQDISSPDRHLHGDEREAYYESKLLEALVDEIFSKKMGNGGSDSPQLEAKKRKRELEETVKWLRGAAVNPVDPTYVIREREQEVLKMRREMFLKLDGIANLEDLPNFASLSPKDGPPLMETKKRKRELEKTVKWLRGTALNPVDPTYVIHKREQEVLKMRREMFLKMDDVANLEDLPNFDSLRKKKKAWHYSDEQYKGKRRSERIARNLNITAARLAILRKRIGVGDLFQADVPDWLGPLSDEDLANYRNDSDTSRWLGTHLWPQKPVTTQTRAPQNLLRHVNDKLMPNYCRCIARGAVECVRYHVNVARSQLKSELGQAFRALGFDFMGEGVEKVFTREQQMLFYSLERGITPLSGPKGFWSTASNHLGTKERRHLVRYFFNVYLLRRVGNQSRLGPASAIDSDEDDMDDDEDVEQVCYDSQKGSSVIVQASRYVSSDRMQSRKESL